MVSLLLLLTTRYEYSIHIPGTPGIYASIWPVKEDQALLTVAMGEQ